MTDSESLFRRAPAAAPLAPNAYERFGLTQNPFPDKPSVVPGSNDPRLNGSIYWADLRQQEQQTFERLLVPAADRADVRPMAFLMDYATRRGRGIGKTAFLAYQTRRIMADLGNDISGGAYLLFAAHILPPGEGRCRKFWQFAHVLMDALNEQYVIASALWRLRAFSSCVPDSVRKEVGDDVASTLGNDSWLEKRGVNVDFELASVLERTLREAGVDDEVAGPLARSGHSPELFRRDFLGRQTDYRWRQEGTNWVFDHLVRAFRAAEFSGGLLLVDEVEKIVVHQNTKERRMFVEDLRYFLMDGPSQSARSGFYKVLFTIHPYVQELLAPHWSAAGMDRFCALSGDLESEHTIYFEPLKAEMAVPLVKEYLDESRLSSDQRGGLEPFDGDALIEALRLTGGVPGPMLALLRRVLEHAVAQNQTRIGAEDVRRVFGTEPPLEPEDTREEEQLPDAQVDLLGDG